MQILYNADTLAHEVKELVGARLIPAYESPARIAALLAALQLRPRFAVTTVTTDVPRAEAAAAKIHTPEYLDHLRSAFATSLRFGLVPPDGCLLPECFPVTRLPLHRRKCRAPRNLAARLGFFAFDLSSGIGAGTWPAALASADLARRGAEALVARPHQPVLALCRPPGHHCTPDLMGGYCYLNNTAIAVRTLLDALRLRPRRGAQGHGQDERQAQAQAQAQEGGQQEGGQQGDGQQGDGQQGDGQQGDGQQDEDRQAQAQAQEEGGQEGEGAEQGAAEEVEQVSVLDLDFHHGNGTQQIFYADRNPCYVSIHGEDEYPFFSGAACETGDGPGEGYNLNLPIPCCPADEPEGEGEGDDGGSSSGGGVVDWETYSSQFELALAKLTAVRTKWLVISLGFDTFADDPVGKFWLQRCDYATMGEAIGRLALPTLVVLEGGYVVDELGANCVAFLDGLQRGKPAAATGGAGTPDTGTTPDGTSTGTSTPTGSDRLGTRDDSMPDITLRLR